MSIFDLRLHFSTCSSNVNAHEYSKYRLHHNIGSGTNVIVTNLFPPSSPDFWVSFAPAVLRDPADHRRRAQHRGSQRSDPQRGVCPGRVRAPVP